MEIKRAAPKVIFIRSHYCMLSSTYVSDMFPFFIQSGLCFEASIMDPPSVLSSGTREKLSCPTKTFFFLLGKKNIFLILQAFLFFRIGFLLQKDNDDRSIYQFMVCEILLWIPFFSFYVKSLIQARALLTPMA